MPTDPVLPAFIDPAKLDEFLVQALAADVGSGDVTTLATVASDAVVWATIESRQYGIAAGLYVVQRVFALADPDLVVDWQISDGGKLCPGTALGTITGNARSVLKAERLALNLLQRMCGIARETYLLLLAASPARVRGTRKTAPGLNLLDKWAIMLGGGESHRLGLYDRMLIKDNHIAAAGSVRAALQMAQQYRDHNAPGMCIEVEVCNHAELQEALTTGGFDEILLDNMAPLKDNGRVDTTHLERAVQEVGGRYVTEASGNIDIVAAQAISKTGVDFVSSGAITHSINAFDVALNISNERRH